MFEQLQGVGQRLGVSGSPPQLVAGGATGQAEGQGDLVRGAVAGHTDLTGHDGSGVVGAAATELGQYPHLPGGGPGDQVLPPDQRIDQQGVAHRRGVRGGGFQVEGQPAAGLPVRHGQRGRLGWGVLGSETGYYIGRIHTERSSRVGALEPPLIRPRVRRQTAGRGIARIERIGRVAVVAQPGQSRPPRRVVQVVVDIHATGQVGQTGGGDSIGRISDPGRVGEPISGRVHGRGGVVPV
ncbi:MAG TPA: hypothetical protein VNA11_14295 [Pseudonocardia sp.]|nr:hypothetical protein [Pseudonocardia sp.]